MEVNAVLPPFIPSAVFTFLLIFLLNLPNPMILFRFVIQNIEYPARAIVKLFIQLVIPYSECPRGR
jgi:hypothetical protein